MHAGGTTCAGREGGPLAAVSVRSAGGWHADDEKRTFERVSWVVGARGAWPIETGRAVLSPFVATENVTSARYSDRVRINATGGRYFEPAPPLLVRGGISVEVG